MITVGDAAPDLSLMGTDDKMHCISDYRGNPVVLFFFPKCFTDTCERQISGHSQRVAEFDALGAKIIGVSTDHTPSQKAFKKGCDPEDHILLLSDFRHRLVKLFGVNIDDGEHPNHRATFIIDSQGIVRNAQVEKPRQWAGIEPELAAIRAL
ncbi:MAG: redoxin domain-containing protein [Chloroflexi bacterium]|nr:redoxin domain-containing protein [Chloroflexota bacterium]